MSMEDEERFMTITETSIEWLLNCIEVVKQQQGGRPFTCQIPSSDLWCRLEPSTNIGKTAFDWTKRLRMALSHALQVSSRCEQLLDFVCRSVALNGDLGLLLMQQLSRCLENGCGRVACGRAGSASVNVADGQVEVRPPMGPTAADLALAAYVFFAGPAAFGQAALQAVAMVTMLSSPKELSSWVAAYSSKGLTTLTDWLLEVALGWLASPLNMDEADYGDGTKANALDEGTFMQRQLFDMTANANGASASARCREPWPRVRCGAILLAAMSWSCRLVARRVITEVLDRLGAAGDGSEEELEGDALPAVEGINRRAAAPPPRGLYGDVCDDGGVSSKSRPEWQVLQSITTDMARVMGLRSRVWALKQSDTSGDVFIDNDKAVWMLSDLCGEDVDFYEHLLCHSVDLLDILEEVAAFLPGMRHATARRFIGVAAPLLPHSEPLIEALLLEAANVATEAADAAAVEDTAMEAAAAAARDGGKFLTGEGVTSPTRIVPRCAPSEGCLHSGWECPTLAGAATPARKSSRPGGSASLMSTPCASQTLSEYSLGSVLCDSPEGPSVSSAAWLLQQLRPQATNAKASSVFTGDENDAALAARGDAGALPSPVALALEVICAIITHVYVVPVHLLPYAKKLVDGLVRLASRCSPLDPRAAARYMRGCNDSAAAATGTLQDWPGAVAGSGLSASPRLLGAISKRILFRLQTALVVASRLDGVTSAGGLLGDGTGGTDLSLLSLDALAASLRSCLQRDTHDEQSGAVRAWAPPPSGGADEPGRRHKFQIGEQLKLRRTSAAASLKPAAPAARTRCLSHCLRWRLAHKSACSDRRDVFGGSNAQLPQSSRFLTVGRQRGPPESDGKHDLEFALAAPPIATLIVALGQALVALGWSSLGAESGSHGNDDAHLRSPAARDQLFEHVGLLAELLVLAVFGDGRMVVQQHSGDGGALYLTTASLFSKEGRQHGQHQPGQLDAEDEAVLQLRMQVLAGLIDVLTDAPEGLSLNLLKAAGPLLLRPPPQQARQEGDLPGVLLSTSDCAEVPDRGPELASDSAAGGGAQMLAAQIAMLRAVSLACACFAKDDSAVTAKQPSLDRRMGPHAGTVDKLPKSAQSGHEDVAVVRGALNNRGKDAHADAAGGVGDKQRAVSTALIGLLSCHAALSDKLKHMDASPSTDGGAMHLEGKQRGETPSEAVDTGLTPPGTAERIVSVNVGPPNATQHGREAVTRDKPLRRWLSETVGFGGPLGPESADCNDRVASAGSKSKAAKGAGFFIRGNPRHTLTALAATTPVVNARSDQGVEQRAVGAGEGSLLRPNGRISESVRGGATPQSYSQPLPAAIPVTSPAAAAVARPILDTWPVSLQASTELLQRLLQLSANSQSPMSPASHLQRWQLIAYTAGKAQHMLKAGSLEAPTQPPTGAASDHGHCSADGAAKVLAALGRAAVDVALEARAAQEADLSLGAGAASTKASILGPKPLAAAKLSERPGHGLTAASVEQTGTKAPEAAAFPGPVTNSTGLPEGQAPSVPHGVVAASAKRRQQSKRLPPESLPPRQTQLKGKATDGSGGGEGGGGGCGSGALAGLVRTRGPTAGTSRPGLNQGGKEQRHPGEADSTPGQVAITKAGGRSGTESEVQQDTCARPSVGKRIKDAQLLRASLSMFHNFSGIESLDAQRGGRRSRRSCNDMGRVDGGVNLTRPVGRKGSSDVKPTNLTPKCGSGRAAAAGVVPVDVQPVTYSHLQTSSQLTDGGGEPQPPDTVPVVAAAPPAGAPSTVSQARSWKTEIISAANQARMEALQLLAAVVRTAVAVLPPSMAANSAIHGSSAAELVAACSMLQPAPAPKLEANPRVRSSDGNAAASGDTPISNGAMSLLQPLLKRLYPPSVLEDAVRDGLLVVRPHVGPALMQMVQQSVREQPLEALALSLLEEVWHLLLGQEGERELNQQQIAQTQHGRHRGLTQPLEAASQEVAGKPTLGNQQEDIQKHLEVGKLVNALVAIAAALPVSTDYASPGHEALVDAITEICSRMLLRPAAVPTRSYAASARASATNGGATFTGRTARLLTRIACISSECDRVLAIAAQLLLALPNVLGRLEARGGDAIREAKAEGGSQPASSRAPPQLHSPQWPRICPYVCEAATCGLAGTHAPTAKADNSNSNGGSGPASLGTATNAVPPWLQNSSAVQIAQVLLEFSSAVLPTVLMAAALSGCRTEADANGGSFDDGDLEELQLEGLPDAVATVLACCLQAIELLMLPCSAAASGHVLGTHGATAHAVTRACGSERDDADKQHRLLVEALCQLRCVASCAVTCTWLLVRRVSAASAALPDALGGRGDASADVARDKSCFETVISAAANVATDVMHEAADDPKLFMVISLWRYHSRRVAALNDQFRSIRSHPLRRQARGLKVTANGWQIVWDRLIKSLGDALLRAPSSLANLNGRRCNGGRRGGNATAAAAGPSLLGPLLAVARTLREALVKVHGCAAGREAYPASPPSCAGLPWAQPTPMHVAQPHGKGHNRVSAMRPNYSTQMVNPAGHSAGDTDLGRREGLHSFTTSQVFSEQGPLSPLTAREDYNDDDIPDEPLFLLFGNLNSDDDDDDDQDSDYVDNDDERGDKEDGKAEDEVQDGEDGAGHDGRDDNEGVNRNDSGADTDSANGGSDDELGNEGVCDGGRKSASKYRVAVQPTAPRRKVALGNQKTQVPLPTLLRKTRPRKKRKQEPERSGKPLLPPPPRRQHQHLPSQMEQAMAMGGGTGEATLTTGIAQMAAARGIAAAAAASGSQLVTLPSRQCEAAAASFNLCTLAAKPTEKLRRRIVPTPVNVNIAPDTPTSPTVSTKKSVRPQPHAPPSAANTTVAERASAPSLVPSQGIPCGGFNSVLASPANAPSRGKPPSTGTASGRRGRRNAATSQPVATGEGMQDGDGNLVGVAAKEPVAGRKRSRSQRSSKTKTEAAAATAPTARGRRRKPAKPRTSTNPFLAACLKETEGRDSDTDCSWSDLEDFIVCQPGRDYGKLLAKKYYYAADDWTDVSEDPEE